MPKEEWGTKRVCPNCATRFYDLMRDPMTCPSCGHSFDLASLISGKGQTTAPPKQINSSDDALDADETEVLDDDDTDVDLDEDVLEEDDDGEDTVDLDEIADVAADDDDD